MRAPTDRPNIVLINADDLGYGDIGCYGSTCHRTPAIDGIAKDGIQLTAFYDCAPVCTPSRAGLMTGCYARRLSMDLFQEEGGHSKWVLFPGDPWGLNPTERTVAQALRQAGYATGIVGKWHLGDQPAFLPAAHGFDLHYGIPYSNDMGPIDAKPDYPPLPLVENDEILQANPDLAALTERLTTRAVRFIREHRDEPFFLYFAHFHPHVPNYAPEEFIRRSQNGRYGACVEEIDWSVAVLRHELARLGLAENTLVIFTSDNGAADNRRNLNGGHAGSNAPLRGHKGTTFEGGLRVPCVAAWPGTLASGRRSDELTTNLDWLPTLAHLGGTPLPDDRAIDGRDLSEVLLGDGVSPHEDFVYYRCAELQAIRDHQYKLHLKTGELYDLKTDPSETQDIAAETPEAVKALEVRADAWRTDIGDRATGATGDHVRPSGLVEDPQPLCDHDPDCPYMVALYDLDPDEPGRFAKG